jgi:subtilase family serine protease
MCTAYKGNIVGTYYCRVSGTSMATPHVAGLIALILSKDPTLSNEEVRQIIRRGSVDLGATGKDKYFGFGRIDAGDSISISDTKPLAPIIIAPRSRTSVYGEAFQIMGSVPGLDFAQYTVEVGLGRDPSSWTTLKTSTTQVIDSILTTIDTTQMSDGRYIFRLTATDTYGKNYQFQVHDVNVDNFDADMICPLSLVSHGINDVIGSAQTKHGLHFGYFSC